MPRPKVDLSRHPVIDIEALPLLEYPAVIFEGEQADSDGVTAYIYTVAGMVRGVQVHKNLIENGQIRTYGALVGGDCILVHARNRADADAMAIEGLWHTMAMTTESLQALAQKQNEGIIIESDYRLKRESLH